MKASPRWKASRIARSECVSIMPDGTRTVITRARGTSAHKITQPAYLTISDRAFDNLNRHTITAADLPRLEVD